MVMLRDKSCSKIFKYDLTQILLINGSITCERPNQNLNKTTACGANTRISGAIIIL